MTLTSLGFTLTEAAKNKLIDLLRLEPIRKHVRVSITGGGCSGLSYGLELEERSGQSFTDHVLIRDEVTLVVLTDAKSHRYLVGTTLDYTDGLNGKGFEFHNPNATRTCGCGSSFSV